MLNAVASVGPSTADEVRELVERAAASRGWAGLTEARLRALDAVASGGDDVVLIAVAARRGDDGALVGWAQADGPADADTWTLEVVDLPDADDDLVDRLADAALAAVGSGVGLRWWVTHAGAADDGRARRLGFAVERDLLQLRCRLPLPGDDTRGATVTTRAFRVGEDEDGWLRQNNRAFAGHPEQGGWDRTTLLGREREPWFDPEGFRVLEVDGRIAGSCWTKVHGTVPPTGEIYVIGVDPDFHGRGWGRALTEDGFRWLAGRGITHGMLYVDAANTPAVSLYRSMGMTADHVDRAYVRDADRA